MGGRVLDDSAMAPSHSAHPRVTLLVAFAIGKTDAQLIARFLDGGCESQPSDSARKPPTAVATSASTVFLEIPLLP